MMGSALRHLLKPYPGPGSDLNCTDWFVVWVALLLKLVRQHLVTPGAMIRGYQEHKHPEATTLPPLNQMFIGVIAMVTQIELATHEYRCSFKRGHAHDRLASMVAGFKGARYSNRSAN